MLEILRVFRRVGAPQGWKGVRKGWVSNFETPAKPGSKKLVAVCRRFCLFFRFCFIENNIWLIHSPKTWEVITSSTPSSIETSMTQSLFKYATIESSKSVKSRFLGVFVSDIVKFLNDSQVEGMPSTRKILSEQLLEWIALLLLTLLKSRAVSICLMLYGKV